MSVTRTIEIRSGGTRQWAAVLLLVGLDFLPVCQPKKAREVDMFPDHVNRLTDTKSDLVCSLTVLRGADGGASAVVVELRNPSEDHDVVLKVNTEMSAVIMLTVTDHQGTVLSRPARKFNSSEVQRFVTVRIAHALSHR